MIKNEKKSQSGQLMRKMTKGEQKSILIRALKRE